MPISVQCHLNVFVPQPFLDNQWFYALVDQICHMAVTDIVHSDWFYTGQCFIFLKTFLQCSRHNQRQTPLIFRKSIMLLCILLYLFLKKIGNINSTDRIFCFWVILNIFSWSGYRSYWYAGDFHSYQNPKNSNARSSRFPNSCPEQNFKYQIIFTPPAQSRGRIQPYSAFVQNSQLICIRFPIFFTFLHGFSSDCKFSVRD